MVIPLEVTFRHMAHSNSLEEAVRQKAEKLEQIYPRIISCRVAIEAENKRTSTKAMVYRVRVDVTVPGGEIVGARAPAHQPFHEDIQIAIRDAFDSARRELQDYVGRQRGYVKSHEPRPHGRVVRVFHDRGYGFLECDDGYEVYFHQNAVVNNGFQRIAVGDEVRYEEEAGERGPQASTVAVLAKAS
ncbi:MAG: HPF/RaiA family ribosome-associated protein [Minicystis sp.]